MIRKANINDFRTVDRMARGFYHEAGYKELYGVDIDEDSLVSFLVAFLTDENKVILIDEDKGMIAGILVPWFFNHQKTLAQEMAWWVEPAQRKTMTGAKLYKAFEKWAIARGASIFVMGSLPSLNGQRVDKFYERNGMKNTENMFGKALSWPH